MKTWQWMLRVFLVVVISLIACSERGDSGPIERVGSIESALASSFDMSVVTPANVSIDRVAIGATGALDIDDRAKVGLPGELLTVSNVGPSATHTLIGVEARVGELFSRPSVDLRPRAVVEGHVTTEGSAQKSPGATVALGTTESSPIAVRERGWNVNFPSAHQDSVSLEPGAARVLAPGSYGEVALKHDAHLRVSSGTYYMLSLDMEPGATLIADQTKGPVFLYVLNNVILRGQLSGGTDLLLGYLGTSTVFVESPFTGTLVAPRAKINISPFDVAHRGSFFGGSVEVHPGAQLALVPFPWGLIPVSDDVAADLRGTVLPTGRVFANGDTVGATAGDFAVVDGAAVYNVPLWTPPGREGMGPSLNLTYNSRGGWGTLGVGWSLSGFGLSEVTRCVHTIAQDGRAEPITFNESDALCLDGQRLLEVAPDEFRTERDTHMRVRRQRSDTGQSFEVRSPDGRILHYGSTEASRLSGQRTDWLPPSPDPIGAFPDPIARPLGSATLAWALDGACDRSGNCMSVTYANVSSGQYAEIEPTSIAYTEGPGYSALRHVDFRYVAQPPHYKYVAGMALQTSRLLVQVTMSGPNPIATGTLRRYDLSYNLHSQVSDRPLLRQLQECDGAGVCKSPTTLSWDEGSKAYSDKSLGSPPEFGIVDDVVVGPGAGLIVTDINGDGRDDLLMRVGTAWYVRLAARTGDGFEPRQLSGLPQGTDRLEVRPIDLEMDGRHELAALVPRGLEKHWEFYRWNGQAFAVIPTTELLPDDPSVMRERVYFGDLNGDGLPEVVRTRAAVPGQPFEAWFYRANDQGKLAPYVGLGPTPETPLPYEFLIPNVDSAAEFASFDGSGRLSFMLQTSNKRYLAATLQKGGFAARQTTLPVASNELDGRRYLFIDLNGDGVQEAVAIPNTFDNHGSVVTTLGLPGVYSNNGLNFAPPVGSPSDTYNYAPIAGGAVEVGDFNEDGLADMLLAGQIDDFRFRTVSLVPIAGDRSKAGLTPMAPIASWGRGMPNIEPTDHPTVKTLDVNGDGLTDVLVSDPFAGVHLYIRQGNKADQLVQVADGQGKIVQIDYKPITPHRGDPVQDSSPLYDEGTDCVYPQACVKNGLWVVAEHRVSSDRLKTDGTPWFNSFDYHYGDGRSDRHGRGWLGFAKVITYDNQHGRSIVEQFDNRTLITMNDPARATTQEIYPFAGLLTDRTVVTELGVGERHQLEVHQTYEPRLHATSGGPYVSRPRTLNVIESEPGVTMRNLTTVNSYSDDEFDNITKRETTSATGFHNVITTDYDNDVATWLLGLPNAQGDTRTTPSGESVTRRVAYTHDPVTGLVTEVTVEPGGGDEVERRTTYSRTTAGQVYRIRTTAAGVNPLDASPAPLERSAQFTYDDVDGVFPSTVTNSLMQTSRVLYHSGLGVLALRRDPNGVATEFQYDGFARPRVRKLPGQGNVAIDYELPNTVANRPNAPNAYTVHVRQAGAGEELVTYNALDDETNRDRRVGDGRLSHVATTYTDRAHEVSTISRPYFDGEPVQTTRLEQDSLLRLTGVHAPDQAESRFFYNGLTTRSVAANKTVREIVRDEFDEIVESRDYDLPGGAGAASVTRYTYGPFGALRRVDTPLPNVHVNMAYDVRGRRIQLDDPDTGRATTHYNAFGEPAWQTAGNNRTVLVRDALGRTTSERVDRGPDTAIVNEESTVWDVAFIGQVAGSTSAAFGTSKVYSYDAFGRLMRTTWSVGADESAIEQRYDGFGRVAQLIYPGVRNGDGSLERFAVDYDYDPAGAAKAISEGSETDAAFRGQRFWTIGDRQADGQVRKET